MDPLWLGSCCTGSGMTWKIVALFLNDSRPCDVLQAQASFMPGKHGDSFPRVMHDRKRSIYYYDGESEAFDVCWVCKFVVDLGGKDVWNCFPIVVHS